MERVNVLFLANIPTDDLRSVGGATVLSKKVLDFLQEKNRIINVEHVQIRKLWRPKFQLIDYLYLSVKYLFIVNKYDVVSIHSTPDMNFTIGPYLSFVGKLFGKKVTYHFFGGNFNNQYLGFSGFLKWIIEKSIFKSDCVFFETQSLVNEFSDRIKNIEWLPNSRRAILSVRPQRNFKKRFVFISRIIEEKGVEIIRQAFSELDSSYSIAFYGPVVGGYDRDRLDTENSTYKGAIENHQVVEVLKENDVLLLPTFFEGEGYPGIIIEALSVGMPVITTDWKSIGEIVFEGYNGFLAKPRDSDSLKEKIGLINHENFETLSNNAFMSFEKFDSEIVFNKLIKSYLSTKI
ncbi:glycosyltransferase [Muricauda sp. ANG21]|uniref:glycosyltransferase n=1 Tax=Allomuricauda sp. ANG21 TaxID=3042468 RepID=UPI0034523B9C